ncbi:sulfite exporter TauE/SafE family protein [Shewanella sp. NIFS-20-20]|uniref:sulfite exporter TauE/SafE family protein n=1 Tax=Shewanella sp. NIFS-20-20 TaxID=2853806 RepID=UPI001C479E9D|nr:sulfite exporter TauE/SafE family protein [Shewanella sp. NIFS-20-20]MBV7314493.1 sulfite exporter TauE/SafE family protein [Shewanella sp. NIFS-20-20]
MSITEYCYLGMIAIFSGIAQATVGGGGLLQLPALFNAMPGVAIPVVIGTNKLAMLASGGNNIRRYAFSLALPWKLILPAMVCGCIFAFIGSSLLDDVSETWFKPILLVIMIALAIYTISHKKMGDQASLPLFRRHQSVVSAVIGAMLGFYQGMFGPATLTFATLANIRAFGMDFLHAMASSQVLSTVFNVSALVWFVSHGYFDFKLAALMAIGALIGSQIGTRIALKGGNKVIRILFIMMLVVEIGRYSWVIFN